MRSFYRIIKEKDNWRRILAAAFLIFLLAEWGSHSVIEATPPPSEGAAISASEVPHGDPCETLVLCSDTGRRDQQRSSLGREMTPHSAPLDLRTDLCHLITVSDESRLKYSAARAIFRPIIPPFYPPEIS